MDETEPVEIVTVGQRLKEAREAKGMSLEDIAAQTRIPTRHLSSLEVSEWDNLPAATYSIGFAKNYASVVGLDRNEIGEQLRAEMGGSRPVYAQPEVFEAADPARTMPKGLVFGALALLVFVVLGLTWFSNRSLEPDEPAVAEANIVGPDTAEVVPPPAPAAAQAVVLTATDAVWIEIKDGPTVLKQGQLTPGERFEVPVNATAPVLTTGKPEALSIAVGSRQVAAVGEPGRTVSGVSLKPADLLRPATATAQAAAPAPSTAAPTQQSSRRRAAPKPPAAQAPDAVTPPANSSAPAQGTPDETATQ
ncbi:MAG: helix-turn-helix domain-containing protein [Sphingomicrobium sp.]